MSGRLHGTTFLAASALLASACATGGARRSASVVDYLYPSQEQRVVQPSLPVLTLPLKVGIAFVPAGDGRFDFNSIPEADRQRLLEQVSERFRQEAFVKDIQTIPTTYLQPRGGFTNLEQVAKLLDVDVVALLSYDQTQFTGSTKASLLYWTLAGAYLVEGEKNDTRTLLDAAVFDVKSHKLLFRAPGTSTVKSSSSLSDVERDRRGDAAKGFQLASTELVTNLERELATFKQKVRDQKTDVKVVESDEYKARAASRGAGAADPLLMVVLRALGGAGVAVVRRVRRDGAQAR